MKWLSKLLHGQPVAQPASVDLPQSVNSQRIEWMRSHQMLYQLFDREDGGFTLFGGPGNQLGSVIPSGQRWSALLTGYEVHYDDYENLSQAAEAIVAVSIRHGG